jgi:hypothetical protein
MEDKREIPQWEPMDVQESGHIGEVLQGVVKISPTDRNDEVNADQFEV